jgi:hypothetical protein
MQDIFLTYWHNKALQVKICVQTATLTSTSTSQLQIQEKV